VLVTAFRERRMVAGVQLVSCRRLPDPSTAEYAWTGVRYGIEDGIAAKLAGGLRGWA
jgi:hypothetical protein